MITNVYIDGFNLFYGSLKGSNYTWLDLAQVAQALVPGHQVNQIKYFTAIVEQRPNKPFQQRRQLIYLRALRTIPNLSIHYGKFRTRPKMQPLVNPIDGLPSIVQVLNTEEKGTDVNLATHLLVDGFKNDYEQAVVISNDTDLILPIRVVRDNLLKPVGVINPNNRSGQPKVLRDVATFRGQLRAKVLADCQFPDTLTDSNGTITKPSTW
jgi:uncharacterized LabA/DUF88 family protein